MTTLAVKWFSLCRFQPKYGTFIPETINHTKLRCDYFTACCQFSVCSLKLFNGSTIRKLRRLSRSFCTRRLSKLALAARDASLCNSKTHISRKSYLQNDNCRERLLGDNSNSAVQKYHRKLKVVIEVRNLKKAKQYTTLAIITNLQLPRS